MYYLKKKISLGLIFFLSMLIFFLHAQFRAESEIAVQKKTSIVMGKVTKKTKKNYNRLKPLIDYVAKHLQQYGIIQGDVVFASNEEQMAKYLQNKEIDWVTTSPFSAFILSEKTGAEIMIRRWKQGIPDYQTVFIARKDSAINSLSDLKGKIIAFEKSDSTSSYMVPKSVIINKKLELAALSSLEQKFPADKVGYIFTQSEKKIAEWVCKGLVHAGAYSNLNWSNSDDTPKLFKKELSIFYQTPLFPRAVELIRKDLNPTIKKHLKKILLTAHENPQGEKVLYGYQKTIKFDEIKGEVQKGLEYLKKAYEVSKSIN